MATLKFKDASPYTQVTAPHDVSDYVYTQYVQNVNQIGKYVPTEKPLRIALFGVGRAGSIHLSSLAHNPRVTIVYIVDDMKDKWQNIRTFWRLEQAKFLTSQDAHVVFADTSVDAVVVASPTHTHEAIAKGALASNKAVFCEKPVAEDIASSRRCYEMAQKVGKPLFTAFNRRFDPAYRRVKDRVAAGDVGHVQTIKVCSRDSPLPTIAYLKTSGGIFHDCAVHDIDIMCWVLGEFPCRVSTAAHAHIPEIRAINDHDTVAITLTFPSGTLGMIDLSRNSCHGYDQRLEVFGPRGMVTCGNERPMSAVESQIGLEGSKTNPIYFSFPSRYKLAYVYEMEHFLDVLQGKAVMAVVGWETMAVSKIAAACEESARTGLPVDLKWTAAELPQ